MVRSSWDIEVEQLNSLSAALSGAGMSPGDTAEVTLYGVGVYQVSRHALCLAFCPTFVNKIHLIEQARAVCRRPQQPVALNFSDQLLKEIRRETPSRGFIHMAVLVKYNAVLKLSGTILHAEGVQMETSVTHTASYEQRLRNLAG